MKFLFLSLCGVLFFFSCSSAPRQSPDEVFTERNAAARMLDLANQRANRGKYHDALLMVEDARRIAISCDDPLLLVRTALARGSILFALGRHDDAFQDFKAAQQEGESAGLSDLTLQVQIVAARARLMLMQNPEPAAVQEIRDQVSGYIASIKSDPAAQATGWLVVGMAEKELKRYAEAERAARRALDFHVGNRNLEEAAYSWFFIASIYSVDGRYNDALSALRNAIDFDRRAENGFGLASSWQAMGEVHQKAGNAADAAHAFRRAADIYDALGLSEEAAKAAAKAGS